MNQSASAIGLRLDFTHPFAVNYHLRMYQDDTEDDDMAIRTASIGEHPTVTSDTAASANTFLPVAIGLAGILLGGMALFLHFSGSDNMELTKSAVLEADTRLTELGQQIGLLTERIETLEKEIGSGDSHVRTLARDSQNAFKNVGVEIKRNRDKLAQLETTLAQLTTAVNETRVRINSQSAVTRLQSQAPAAPTPTTTETTLPREIASIGAVQDTVERFHIVESGDTFSSISGIYGVSIASIQNANPDVDSRRMQVGHKLIIPPNNNN